MQNCKTFQELPEFLKLSLLSYSSADLEYTICISGEERLRQSVSEELSSYGCKITVLSDKDILGLRSKNMLEKLWTLWQEHKIRANHPPSEYHCFARWLVLNDLYEKKYFCNTDLVLAHDWDDCFLGKTSFLIDSMTDILRLENLDPVNSMICAYCSIVSDYPLFTMLQPHLMVLNKRAINQFTNELESIVINTKRFMHTRLFADMNLWAYSVSLSMRNGETMLFKQLYHIMGGKYYVCDNIRSFDNPASSTLHRDSIYIPQQINYLANGASHMEYVKLLFDDKVYVLTEDSGALPVFNLQFQGVEGKYLASCLKEKISSYIFH